jgi:hypothetical protein
LAISLLSGVANIVTGGSNVDLEIEDIYQLCCICCEALNLEVSTTNKYKVLCGLYHITKFLLKKVITGYLPYTIPSFTLKRFAISCIIEVMFTI